MRCALKTKLLGFLVAGVLLAEAAILVHLETIRVVLLVLHGIVIALLALGACQANLDSLIRCHVDTSRMIIRLPRISAAADGCLCKFRQQQQQPTSGAD